MPTPEIATIYLDARARIDRLVRPLSDDERARPVAACPGWTVHGVVSHLVGSVDWAAAGRLQGLPTDDDTAEQVAERVDVPTVELLDHWADVAAGFAELGAAADIWPLAIDVVTHEHDIRHALGDRGGRDEPAIGRLAAVLLHSWSPTRTVEVVTPARTARCGGDGSDPLTLRTTDFEVLRLRLGRRSRRQLAALDWSDDPGDVLDEIAAFGLTHVDIDG